MTPATDNRPDPWGVRVPDWAFLLDDRLHDWGRATAY